MLPPAVTCAPNNPGAQETLFRTLTSYRGEGTIKRPFPQRVYNPVGSWTEVRNEETVSERSIRRFARRHLRLHRPTRQPPPSNLQARQQPLPISRSHSSRPCTHGTRKKTSTPSETATRARV